MKSIKKVENNEKRHALRKKETLHKGFIINEWYEYVQTLTCTMNIKNNKKNYTIGIMKFLLMCV